MTVCNRFSKLVDANTSKVVIEHVELATTFMKRFRGFQFRRPLATDQFLWMSPCSSLHTCWMRFDIDVAMFDRHGQLLAIRHRVSPWKFLFCEPKTHSILESSSNLSRLVIGRRYSILNT